MRVCSLKCSYTLCGPSSHHLLASQICLHAQISLRSPKAPCLCSAEGWLADWVLFKLVFCFLSQIPVVLNIFPCWFKQDSQFWEPSKQAQPRLVCASTLDSGWGTVVYLRMVLFSRADLRPAEVLQRAAAPRLPETSPLSLFLNEYVRNSGNQVRRYWH